MSHLETRFDQDLDDGKACEQLVSTILDGRPTLSTPAERDLGDMFLDWLDGQLVEVKWDRKYDEFGNMCIELADLDTTHGRTKLTGVLKHHASGRPVVMVHALGEAMDQFFVYRADRTVMFLRLATSNPHFAKSGWCLKSWWNKTGGTFAYTGGIVVPVRRNMRRYENGGLPQTAFTLATRENLREVVTRMAGTHNPEYEAEETYRLITSTYPITVTDKMPDRFTPCLGDITIKGLAHTRAA